VSNVSKLRLPLHRSSRRDAAQAGLVASGVEETLVLTNDNARYTFTVARRRLKLIELVKYPETVLRTRKKQQPLTNDLAELNAPRFDSGAGRLGDESCKVTGFSR